MHLLRIIYVSMVYFTPLDLPNYINGNLNNYRY